MNATRRLIIALFVAVILFALKDAVFAAHEQSESQTLENAARTDALKNWPGFHASADAILSHIIRHGLEGIGLEEDAMERALEEQARARPAEFAAAALAAIPDGYAAL